MRSPDLIRNAERARSRQNDPKFGELTGLRIDLYGPAMLLDDNVVTNGQTKPRPFTGRFGRKEGTEQFLLHLGRDTSAVVADLIPVGRAIPSAAAPSPKPELEPDTLPELVIRLAKAGFKLDVTSCNVRTASRCTLSCSAEIFRTSPSVSSKRLRSPRTVFDEKGARVLQDFANFPL